MTIFPLYEGFENCIGSKAAPYFSVVFDVWVSEVLQEAEILKRPYRSSNICGSKQAQAGTEGGYQRYGVRSYMHQFYEDCTASMWEFEAFGEADFMVFDTHAVQFNGALDTCKLAGAVLFCIGDTSTAGCLLISLFAKSYSKE
ncbi:neurensin-1-like protein [Cricetulus griseus]|uniref:Neurensin-1-like protein n=1 Tax=Cricetulus griseus TaxID=10029 RepID=A0A061IR57_CRIGR|nr:neurensin-1-like protein [Cricetulus griseus]